MNLSSQQVLETPAPGPLSRERDERPRAKNEEPPLASAEIQGNVFPGFLKDYQTLIFLRIAEPSAFSTWLKELVPSIATMDEVLSFNRIFKAMRFRRGSECQTVKATWVNIAFSFA